MKKRYVAPQSEMIVIQEINMLMVSIPTGNGEITDPGQIQAPRWVDELSEDDLLAEEDNEDTYGW